MLNVVGFEKKKQSELRFKSSSIVSNTSTNVVSFTSKTENKNNERQKAIEAISERVSKLYW
jgi:hypothetical protein